MTEIVYLKLITGEEIIGLTHQTHIDEWVNIEDPLIVRYSADTIAFTVFMQYSDERLFTLRRKDIIIYSKPNHWLIGYYGQWRESFSANGETKELTQEERVALAMVEKTMSGDSIH